MNIRYILPLLTLCLLTACGGGDDEAEILPVVSLNHNANDATSNPDLARWELPRTTAGNIFIAHRTSDGQMNYCLEYNLAANHSQWVAYRYDTRLASQAAPNRTNAWNAEPALNSHKEHQVNIGYFPGYNRGHLVGSAERYYSTEANTQTFYMSNMSPMNGEFNSRYWGAVEDVVRDEWGRKVKSGDTLYIVKGGTLSHTLGTIPVRNTLDQTIYMAVPQYYFLAAMYLHQGSLQAIGFWMENKDYKNTTTAYLKQLARESACSIDELERLTGLDFFCNLPDAIEERVESRYSLTLWSGL